MYYDNELYKKYAKCLLEICKILRHILEARANHNDSVVLENENT